MQRFLSVDPLAQQYAYYTPYQFAGNMPIAAIDIDGAEQYIIVNEYSSKGGKTELELVHSRIYNSQRFVYGFGESPATKWMNTLKNKNVKWLAGREAYYANK